MLTNVIIWKCQCGKDQLSGLSFKIQSESLVLLSCCFFFFNNNFWTKNSVVVSLFSWNHQLQTSGLTKQSKPDGRWTVTVNMNNNWNSILEHLRLTSDSEHKRLTKSLQQNLVTNRNSAYRSMLYMLLSLLGLFLFILKLTWLSKNTMGIQWKQLLKWELHPCDWLIVVGEYINLQLIPAAVILAAGIHEEMWNVRRCQFVVIWQSQINALRRFFFAFSYSVHFLRKYFEKKHYKCIIIYTNISWPQTVCWGTNFFSYQQSIVLQSIVVLLIHDNVV